MVNKIENVGKNVFDCVVIKGGRRWKVTVAWEGKWVAKRKTVVNDGYYVVRGQPSVGVEGCTGYQQKLHPKLFSNGHTYALIEVKNIGYLLYTRIVYDLGSNGMYEGVVRNTYGIDNSYVEVAWGKINKKEVMGKDKDYGYGGVIKSGRHHGYAARFFFNQ